MSHQAVKTLGVSVIGGRRPFRSRTLEEFLVANSLAILDHAQPWLKEDDDRSRFASDMASRLIWGRTLTLGEIGCALSHRYAYAAGLESGCEWLLVLEDDASPDPRLIGHLMQMMRNFDTASGPNIINLDVIDYFRRPKSRLTDAGHRDTDLVALKYPLPNASAYAINRAAMMVALRAPWRVASPPDWPPWATLVQFWTPSARLVNTLGAQSTIAGRPTVPSLKARCLRTASTLTGVTWVLCRDHYVTLANYCRYEFGFRILGSVRLRLRNRGMLQRQTKGNLRA